MEGEMKYRTGPGELVPEANYFTLTILADENNQLIWSTFTHWTGYASRQPAIELRAPSTAIPENMMKHWEVMAESYTIVSNENGLMFYLVMGGNALIETALALKHFPFMREAQPSRQQGFGGFVSAENLPKAATFRAPTPKIRMRVLKRDQYRCKLCGRRPVDHVDVELHVHHIRPWENGGATLEDNLVTLCHTCHKGLDPHFELQLFPLIGLDHIDVETERQRHFDGVRRYREYSKRQWEAEREARTRIDDRSGNQ
jgi:hypothetical protein